MSAEFRNGRNFGKNIVRKICVFVRQKTFAIKKRFLSCCVNEKLSLTAEIITGSDMSIETAIGTDDDENAKRSTRIIATTGVALRTAIGKSKNCLNAENFPDKSPRIVPKIPVMKKDKKTRNIVCSVFSQKNAVLESSKSRRRLLENFGRISGLLRIVAETCQRTSIARNEEICGILDFSFILIIESLVRQFSADCLGSEDSGGCRVRAGPCVRLSIFADEFSDFFRICL